MREGRTDLPLTELSAGAVTQETLLSDLLGHAARRASPLLVVDDRGRLVGLIPQVTLLSALSSTTPQPVDDEDSGVAPARPTDATTEEVAR